MGSSKRWGVGAVFVVLVGMPGVAEAQERALVLSIDADAAPCADPPGREAPLSAHLSCAFQVSLAIPSTDDRPCENDAAPAVVEIRNGRCTPETTIAFGAVRFVNLDETPRTLRTNNGSFVNPPGLVASLEPRQEALFTPPQNRGTTTTSVTVESTRSVCHVHSDRQRHPRGCVLGLSRVAFERGRWRYQYNLPTWLLPPGTAHTVMIAGYTELAPDERALLVTGESLYRTNGWFPREATSPRVSDAPPFFSRSAAGSPMPGADQPATEPAPRTQPEAAAGTGATQAPPSTPPPPLPHHPPQPPPQPVAPRTVTGPLLVASPPSPVVPSPSPSPVPPPPVLLTRPPPAPSPAVPPTGRPPAVNPGGPPR